MTRKIFVALLLCVFLASCVSHKPKTDIQMNVADDNVNIDSIYIGLNAQQLPTVFADSLRTSLESTFQTEGVPIVVKNLASDDELTSLADVDASHYSHIMLIITRQIVVNANESSRISNLTLNVTLIDTQKDAIVMRANVQVHRGRNEILETVFTSKPISETGEEEGQVAAGDLISKMRTLGLLGA